MASNKPKRAVKLFGTELQEAKGRVLRAGPITAVLDNGALRYIRLGDIEVLRAIAFLVRDENWGTYTPEIRNQKIRQTPKGFTVTYDARCGAPGRALAYNAEISAKAEGTLSFTATAKPESDFPTNRTGFVVLHPLKGVAGAPVEIEHVDGKRRKDKFPALINPVQPFLNVRAIRHEVSSGVSATVRMEGDAFETEDHRNWTDASFKTYVRPLALPWPYTLPKGEPFTQSVTLTFSGKLPRPKTGGTARPALVSLGRAAGSLPGIAIAVSAAEAEHAFEQADLVKHAAPSRLLCEIDAAGTDLAELARIYRKLSEATGIPVSLEIVIPGRTEPSVELEPVVRALDDSGLEPVAVAVSPAIDLKAILPGSAGGDAPPLEKIYRAARTAFPGAAIGGGMFSFFTELNRKRPPAELLDFVTHTTCPIVHAADDVSVMESLEALPSVVQSTRALIGRKKAYHIGPSTIPARLNPYGASTASNPGDLRVCLADNDPRHRGLFGAAWTLGYVAALAYSGVEQVSAGAATGPTGTIYQRGRHKQPYFDSVNGAAIYPLYHVLASLASACGSKLRQASTDAAGVAALAYGKGKNQVLWLANLTGDKRKVKVAGFEGAARLHMLDEASFEKATRDPSFLARNGKPRRKVSTLELGPYAVARLTADG